MGAPSLFGLPQRLDANLPDGATLLSFIHPFDLSAIDLLVHGLAISGIIIAGRHFGYRWLGG